MISRTHTRWLTVGLLAVAIAVVAATAALAAPDLAPTSQGSSCAWQSIGSAAKSAYFAAAAMDTENNHLYVYGGLDQDREALNTVQRIDLSGASIKPAPHTTVTGVPALKRYGAAGAFRAKGDDSAVYFIGGSGSMATGSGTDDVQVYNVKTKTWSLITPGGAFEDRLLHAAAYDPEHDVIWITGGIGQCSLDDIDQGKCTARTFATKYLEFDDTTGDASWHQLSGTGPNQVYGHVMVYDSAAKQMLLVGGTRDGQLGMSTVWALDLSKDVDSATWDQLSVGGVSLPRLALHGGAYDASRNRVVVYGGVTSNMNLPDENVSNGTYALDLTQSPPAWADLGTTVQDRVGPAMGYAPLHQSVILAGGRRKDQGSSPQDVQRGSYALECADQPTQIPPPPTVPATSTSATPTDVPTQLPPPPTVPVTPTKTTEPPESVQVCDFITRFGRVPAAVIADAVANPTKVYGFYLTCNPNVQPSLANRPRRYLSIHDTARPWHPLYNSLELKCGCP
ncbi:MAG: kelch repeat-containing protein [Anaerolineae bacterium]